jgi:hypothetical protein
VRTVVQLKSSLSEAEAARLRGKRGRIEDASVVLRDAGSVYKPAGQRLLTLVRGAIAKPLIDAAFPFMWSLREIKTDNRGAYVGVVLQNKDRSFGPCAQCDAGSGSRAGLLPKYPPVTPQQRTTVHEVERGSPRGSNGVFVRRLPTVA